MNDQLKLPIDAEYVRRYDERAPGPPRNDAIYHRRRSWFVALKASLSCQVCGATGAAAMEFHHINPNTKRFEVGLGNITRATHQFIDEMRKCAVLCSNCHRAAHAEEILPNLKPIDISVIPPMPR